ncbi:Uncharacterised protein [Myroides odoratus]|nr:hypothetical protein Myrod_2854 [Myroides odoratus DSM 2801]EKB04331.1 hypothetical protein HMPREF9716_03243 [Myroides odoratus CIP 103059]STZ30951.1 Uncharacterised protein [Myroides odoratus]
MSIPVSFRNDNIDLFFFYRKGKMKYARKRKTIFSVKITVPYDFDF